MVQRPAIPPETAKWAILLGFVVLAGGAILAGPSAKDPLQPGLLALLWTIWLKLFLEYGWRLPMRFLAYVRLAPGERAARNRVMLIMTAVAVGVTVWYLAP